jgi:hypothetical protein
MKTFRADARNWIYIFGNVTLNATWKLWDRTCEHLHAKVWTRDKVSTTGE